MPTGFPETYTGLNAYSLDPGHNPDAARLRDTCRLPFTTPYMMRADMFLWEDWIRANIQGEWAVEWIESRTKPRDLKKLIWWFEKEADMVLFALSQDPLRDMLWDDLPF